jgi:hypothetical protein
VWQLKIRLKIDRWVRKTRERIALRAQSPLTPVVPEPRATEYVAVCCRLRFGRGLTRRRRTKRGPTAHADAAIQTDDAPLEIALPLPTVAPLRPRSPLGDPTPTAGMTAEQLAERIAVLTECNQRLIEALKSTNPAAPLPALDPSPLSALHPSPLSALHPSPLSALHSSPLSAPHPSPMPALPAARPSLLAPLYGSAHARSLTPEPLPAMRMPASRSPSPLPGAHRLPSVGRSVSVEPGAQPADRYGMYGARAVSRPRHGSPERPKPVAAAAASAVLAELAVAGGPLVRPLRTLRVAGFASAT